MAKKFSDLPVRSQKALVRKYRKEKKVLANWEAEWHEEDQPAYDLIKKVFGLSESEFSEYFSIAEKFHLGTSFMQSDIARAVFRPDRLKKENLENLLTKFEMLERASQSLEKNKAFQLISRGYDLAVYQKKFDALDLPDFDMQAYEDDPVHSNRGPDKISVELSFNDYTEDLVFEFNKIKFDSKLEVYKNFVKSIENMIRETGAEIAKFFVDDLAKEARLNYPFDEQPIFMKQFKGSLSQFDIDSEYFIESLAFMNEAKQSYVSISESKASKKIFELLKLAEHGEQHRGRIITEYAGKLIGFFEGKNSALLTELVRSIPSEQRTDLLALVMNNEEAIDFFKSVKRYQVIPVSYANFLLNFWGHELALNGEKKTCFEIVSEVVKFNPGTAVTHLIDSTAECILAGNTTFVYDAATTSKLAPVILRDYLEYSAEGNELKKSALMALFYEDSDEFDMNYLLKKLKSASNESLAIIEVNARSLHKLSEEKREEKRERIKKQEKTFLDLILRDGDGEENEKLISAYSILKSEFLENKMRQVYSKAGESLPVFCGHVIGLSQSEKGAEVLRVLLKSPVLFEAYIGKLEENGSLYTQLENVSTCGMNAYSSLRDVLIDNDRFVEEENTERPAELAALEPIFQRIFIFGGWYSTEVHKRVEEASPVEIRMHDHSPGKHVDAGTSTAGLRDNDAVIWVTASSSHTHYYGVKQYCKDHNIRFYHLNNSGVNSLINCVNDVAYGRV